jgi:hypothetical protein
MKCQLRNLLPLICVLLVPVLAFGGVPDINNCSIATRTTVDVSVLLCPACDGYAYSAAQVFGGTYTDATIEVYIRDGAGLPVAGVPADDIYIDHTGLVWCPDGNIADFDTDPTGYTEFALPSCGGGCATGFQLNGFLGTPVGTPFIQNPVPHIQYNSPDTNGDLVVDLVDLQWFAAAYLTGPYTYCADYFWDGVMDLRDLQIMAAHYGHSCP